MSFSTTPSHKEQSARAALYHMLMTMRPHGTKATATFCKHWIDPLGCQIDAAGNRFLRIGDAPVMFSSHVDTVHSQGGGQRIYDDNGIICLTPGKANCLGADDTAGVWLMREMAINKVPGLYVFHQGEECGGVGSRFIAANKRDMVKEMSACIAFDRRGTTSIITEQMCGRCCSDVFGKSLIEALGLEGMKLDDTGSFTDSANYVRIIPECTNVSSGYYDEHTKKECLDTDHLFTLREAMLTFDHSKLVIVRDPSKVETRYYPWRDWDENAYYQSQYGASMGGAGDYTYSRSLRRSKANITIVPKSIHDYTDSEWEQREQADALVDFVTIYPTLVSHFLMQHGYIVEDLEEYKDECEQAAATNGVYEKEDESEN